MDKFIQDKLRNYHTAGYCSEKCLNEKSEQLTYCQNEYINCKYFKYNEEQKKEFLNNQKKFFNEIIINTLKNYKPENDAINQKIDLYKNTSYNIVPLSIKDHNSAFSKIIIGESVEEKKVFQIRKLFQIHIANNFKDLNENLEENEKIIKKMNLQMSNNHFYDIDDFLETTKIAYILSNEHNFQSLIRSELSNLKSFYEDYYLSLLVNILIKDQLFMRNINDERNPDLKKTRYDGNIFYRYDEGFKHIIENKDLMKIKKILKSINLFEKEKDDLKPRYQSFVLKNQKFLTERTKLEEERKKSEEQNKKSKGFFNFFLKK